MLTFKTNLRSRSTNWQRLSAVLTNVSEFWKEEGIDYIREWYRKLFDSEGATLGKRWAPHRPATLAIRARQGARGGIGWHSGRLRTSLTRKNAAESVRVVRGNTLEYGTTVNRAGFDYASRFHSGGMVRQVFGRPKKRPYKQQARPLYTDPMPKTFTDPLRQKLNNWIQQRIIKEGL